MYSYVKLIKNEKDCYSITYSWIFSNLAVVGKTVFKNNQAWTVSSIEKTAGENIFKAWMQSPVEVGPFDEKQKYNKWGFPIDKLQAEHESETAPFIPNDTLYDNEGHPVSSDNKNEMILVDRSTTGDYDGYYGMYGHSYD